MKILVSGGAGFIGSNLCAKLKEKDLEVIIVDDLSTGSEGNLIEGCDFYNLDLSKEDSYKKLLPESLQSKPLPCYGTLSFLQ